MWTSSQPSASTSVSPASSETPVWTQISLGLSGCLLLLWSLLLLRRLLRRWKPETRPVVSPPCFTISHLPCLRCEFLHGNVHLPCAVNPLTVLTPAAQDCPDFEPKGSPSPASVSMNGE